MGDTRDLGVVGGIRPRRSCTVSVEKVCCVLKKVSGFKLKKVKCEV